METTQKNNTNTGEGLKQFINAIYLPETETKPKGIFKGKIIDAKTGARVFGVVVELVGTGRTYITSPTGYFKMTDVPEGIYLARFSFPGFQETSEVVAILNSEELDLTLSLEVV
ncbi:MAG: carboxypeptidase-like regulatory domain-containing protein [Flavobacteriales bacterium]|nr:carboxypeptidase-like regulatory domain-containing protein [Flavobacteriales bacterium]